MSGNSNWSDTELRSSPTRPVSAFVEVGKSLAGIKVEFVSPLWLARPEEADAECDEDGT